VTENTPSHLSAWYLLFAILLVFLNAFFVAAEFAMVKVRSTRLETRQEVGSLPARWAYTIVQNLNSYLSATQLGVTLASLGLGWIGEPAFAEALRPFFHMFSFSEKTVHWISFGVGFTIITVLHLVVGELVPKRMAIQSAEKILMVTALPLRIFFWIFFPFLWFLNHSTNWVIQGLGLKPNQEDLVHDEEEIRLIVEDSYEEGTISPRKASLLENVFEFTHRTARFIMRPRQEIIFLDLRKPLKENLQIVKESEHTRFPLCDGSLDRIVGLINIKDIVWQFEDTQLINLFDLKRPILLVPEGKPLDQLLREFQSKKIHLAIVIDEFGATTGLLTLEDVLEELVGEIQDEFDQEATKIFKNSERSYVVEGSAPIREVERTLDVALFDPNNVSIGGYFVDHLGRLAKEGDSIEIPPYIARALEVKNRRVVKLLFEKQETTETPALH